MYLATVQIDWRPWGPTWFVALVMIGIIVFLAWLYTIDGRRLTKTQRRFLLTWRILTVVIILLMLMEPSYKLTSLEKRPPVTAVVIDESTSMSLPEARDNPFIDFYGQKDRAQKSRFAAAKNVAANLIPDLAKTHRIKVFLVSDQTRSVADFLNGEKLRPADVLKTLEAAPLPTGNYSNLGEALRDVMNASANIKLSALFFLTDGRKTGGITLGEASMDASARKIPVNTIGFGTAEPLPDLRMIELLAPPEANVNDIMTVQVTIINTLQPNLKVDLNLFEQGVTNAVSTKNLVLPLGERRMSISTIPRREGEIKYTLTLPVFPEELDPDNNKISFHVNVVKRQLKMLFVAGAPTMEFHHLVPTLCRDKVITVSCFLQTADVNAIQQGNDVIEELPRTPSQWNRYDVIVLYDIDPNKFSEEQENGLEQLVQNGGGVLFIAGRVHGMASLLQVRGAKMQAMLPVEINKNLYPDIDNVYSEPFHVVRTREGERHPLLIFAPGREKNDEVWRSFSDLNFFWRHPVTGVKRQAVPLMVQERKGGGGGTEGRDCVMALMRYGKGSCLFLGINTMWFWRFPMESFDYDQFWTQTARYLGEFRMLGAQRQVMVSTDKKMYAPGETVRIQLSVLDPALASQLRNEQVFATVTDADKGEYSVMLNPVPQDLSARTGKFQARRLGEHEVRVKHILAEDLAARKALFDEKTHFNVEMQSLEFRDTTADLVGLADVARQTGGTSLDHSTVGEGLKKLAEKVDATPQMVPHESYDDLWDRWYVLLVLLTLGAVELWFRRNWGLL